MNNAGCKKLSSLLHESLFSEEIVEFYKKHSDWFDDRRLRRFVYHTSMLNDHLVLECEELYRYAARLLSMQEAFLLWVESLPKEYRNLLTLLVKYPVLSVDYAYKTAGILKGNLSGSDYKSVGKTEILNDIRKKQKYILENIAVYKNGLVYCPVLFRRYMAEHLGIEITLEAADFTPVAPAFPLDKVDCETREKLKAARTIREAVKVIAEAPASFDVQFLVPHLNLSVQYWRSPKAIQKKIEQIDSICNFLEGDLFSKGVDFEGIENSFLPEVVNSIPEFFIPACGNGYFVQLEGGKKSTAGSASFGKRLELTGGDLLYDFVSVPAFNNLLLILSALGFFKCTLQETKPEPHTAKLYPLGKIKQIKQCCKD